MHMFASLFFVAAAATAPPRAPPWFSAEREALIDLYDATSGPGWKNSRGWKEDSVCHCRWAGVKCGTIIAPRASDHQGPPPCPIQRVISLSFTDNNLIGSLPRWNGTGGAMTGLQRLRINNNDYGLESELPTAWSTCLGSLRELDLGFNFQLTGTLPPQWSSLTSLVSMDLSMSKLSGPLPVEWAPGSRHDHHSSSSSSSSSGSSGLSSLKVLRLYVNALDGSLPPAWATWCSLGELVLNSNHLSGYLPTSWASWRALHYLDLGNNRLISGVLPPEWRSWASLTSLRVYGSQVSGSLPPAWSTWASLQALRLYGTSISGSLPPEWAAMQSLNILYLNGNAQLSGMLPANWAEMASLDSLFLYNSSLSGSLPREWARWGSLHTLHADNNRLSGSLPAEWSRWSSLHTLHLHSNALSGALPKAWAVPSSPLRTGLLKLKLSNNKLAGSVCADWASWPPRAELSGNELPPLVCDAEVVNAAGGSGSDDAAKFSSAGVAVLMSILCLVDFHG